jgi:hypothetical protein
MAKVGQWCTNLGLHKGFPSMYCTCGGSCRLLLKIRPQWSEIQNKSVFCESYVCEKNPRIALFGHFTTGVSDSLQDSLVNGNTQKLWNTHVIARTKLFSIRIETPGLPPATGNTPRRVPLPTMGNMKHSLFGLAQPRNAGPGQ